MVNIVDSDPDDVFAIRRVQKVTWIDTYPNKEFGISKEDIVQRFSGDDTEEGRERIEKRKEIYSDPKIHTWVAKKEEEVIGFCTASKENDVHRIGAIYILPEFQRQKIGQQLLEKALGWLGNQKEIFVNVASYNEQAINFYKKFGFYETGSKINNEVAVLPSGAKIPETELVRK